MSTAVFYMPSNGKTTDCLISLLTGITRKSWLFIFSGKIIHYSLSPQDTSDTSADQPEPIIVFLWLGLVRDKDALIFCLVFNWA